MSVISSLKHELKEDETLYFLHILKTAGTSLISIIENMFDYEQINREIFWYELIENFPEDISKYRFIRGHFGFGLHRVLPKFPIYITMLREPIERVLSYYEHLHEFFDKNPIPQILKDRDEDIIEILNDPNRRRYLTNIQTKAICLDLDRNSLFHRIKNQEKKEYDIDFAIKQEFRNLSEEEILTICKNRISKFAFVGLAEKFEESYLLLNYTFGWMPIQQELPRLNLTPKRIQVTDLPKKTIDELFKCTNLDRKLYNYVKMLFEKRFNLMKNELKKYRKTGDSFNSSNNDLIYELLERHFEQDCRGSKIPLVSSLEVDFGKQIFGSGWQKRELVNDKVYRWTGPDTTTTLYLPLEKARDIRLQMELKAITKDVLDSFKLKVNDMPVEIKNLFPSKLKTTFEGIIPMSLLKRGNRFTCLSFLVSHTVTPNSINSKDEDTRQLGLQFHKIFVNPA